MGRLFDKIKELVADEKYVVGQHASEMLEERGIMEWQAVAAFENCVLLREKSTARPNPSVEVLGTLPDGTEIKVVWSHLQKSCVAKLVTVHFVD